MTTSQIEILFHETINHKEEYGKALYNQLDGVTENQLYNWRKQRTKPTIGDMLNVLYQLKKIEIIPSSSWNKVSDDLKKLSYILNNNGTNAIVGSNKLPEMIEDITGTKKYTVPIAKRPNSNS